MDTPPLRVSFLFPARIFDVIHHCAGSVLTDTAGRAILLWQPRLKYGLPGGMVEPHETPAQAAVREAWEEIGVEIELGYLVGMYHVLGGGRPEQVSFVFAATVVAGTPHVADPEEVLRLEYFAPGHLPSPVLNDVRVALPDFWSGQRGIVREVERAEDACP